MYIWGQQSSIQAVERVGRYMYNYVCVWEGGMGGGISSNVHLCVYMYVLLKTPCAK